MSNIENNKPSSSVLEGNILVNSVLVILESDPDQNIEVVAEKLGFARSTFYKKLRKFDTNFTIVKQQARINLGQRNFVATIRRILAEDATRTSKDIADLMSYTIGSFEYRLKSFGIVLSCLQNEAIAKKERDEIVNALNNEQFNFFTEVAKFLKIQLCTLMRRIEKYGIESTRIVRRSCDETLIHEIEMALLNESFYTYLQIANDCDISPDTLSARIARFGIDTTFFDSEKESRRKKVLANAQRKYEQETRLLSVALRWRRRNFENAAAKLVVDDLRKSPEKAASVACDLQGITLAVCRSRLLEQGIALPEKLTPKSARAKCT